MIPYEDALQIVLENTPRLGRVEVPLDETEGMVLAAPVRSDADHPPFNRSAMDGYAVRSADVAQTPVELAVTETIAAGHTPAHRVDAGQCAKIMTGAPVPDGADTVVMVEHTEAAGPDSVRILKSPAPGSNVCRRGEDFRRGEVIMEPGREIRTQEVALLAALGVSGVPVYRRPTAAVLSTGTEVVPVEAPAGSGKVRDCNSHTLAVLLGRFGIRARCLGIVRDAEAGLRAALETGIESDVLIVSGGVSMGDYDLVPGILKALGVKLLFEKVAIKPGKPTVFGKRGGTCVFGLPGNPVSVQVCAALFLVPALRRMMGCAEVEPPTLRAVLTGDASHKGDRRSHVPVALRRRGGSLLATPVRYRGSGDIFGMACGEALAVLPPGTKTFRSGESVVVVLLDAKRPR